MSLANVQQQFFNFILTAESSIVSDIANSSQLSAQASLEIYRQAYYGRLMEVLTEDYSGLCGLMGEQAFQQLCRDFIDNYPSTHFSLRYYGELLAKFLTHTHHKQRELFVEMANFEWALTMAFDAADRPLLTLVELKKLSSAAWPQLHLALHPSVQVINCRWNTPQLWQAVIDKQHLPEFKKQDAPQAWLVWRKDFASYYRPLSVPENYIIVGCQENKSFAEICEGLCKWMTETEAAQFISQCLRDWVVEEIFVTNVL